MSAKRRSEKAEEMTGRERKKQKTALARTIAVQSAQSTGSSTPTQNAVAGPSKSVQFKGLPSSIDVERFAEARAYEINAMQVAMKNARANASHRAWQQLPRHLRRRAASHDVRRVPLRLRDKARAEMDPMRRKALGRSLPKRGKKKQLKRTEIFLKRQQNKIWLETHIWHAKRMKMEDMWGYRLAVQPTEKSFRPSHRASVHGSILHDASYYGFIELKGPEHVLRMTLESCCDLQGPSPGAKRFSTGARTCETHFYRRASYPYGLIAPGTVIWQPPVSVDDSDKKGSANKKTNSKGKEPEKASNEATRIVWIKVHPSVFQEVYTEIRTAASFALDVAKKDSSNTYEVEMADMRERLNVFEIMGPKSSQIICGALRPVAEDRRPEFKKSWNMLANLQTSASVPRNTVIGFKVYDPRLSFPPKNAKVSTSQANARNIAHPAVAFYPTSVLAQSEIWDEKVRLPLRKPTFKKKNIDERKSQNLVPGTPLQAQARDDRIPVLLIQRSTEGTTNSPSIHGWTLIVPSGWGMPFFSSLTFTGTRVGGQRERQTQSFEAGCSYFPRDYPSTEAYELYSEDREHEEKTRWERKPPAKRPNYEKLGCRSPWTPDWEVVLGLDSPKVDGKEDELVDAQREEAMDVDSVLEEPEEPAASDGEEVEPWLLRGPEIETALSAASSMFNHSTGLLDYVNGLRQKRKMAPLTVRGEDLWKGALVRVAVHMIGRGRPEDLAVIYGMDDSEASKWANVENTRRNGAAAVLGEDAEDESELSIVIPPQEAIIGYVTTGNFSLSVGEGCAIGAIPLVRLFELNEQAKRFGAGKPLIKVRERHEVICRAATIEVVSD